ncbi:MAG: type II toxin-antitoxin system RelE/ParE family toxin [Gammaproteobacteria bacterium]|nr:type II toxin-antitoxin system RelE/ParE family toxin [Gammaproteobacteria bacterium]
MPSFKVTRKAKADLVAIGQFTTSRWGKTHRNSYLKQLDNCFLRITENPELGTACDFIAKGYRKIPQGSHVVFYKPGPNNIIQVIRVLHKNMDAGSTF